MSLEREMATRSSVLAWRIPWTEEPGGLQSMGSQRMRHDWATEQQQQWDTNQKPRISAVFLTNKLQVGHSNFRCQLQVQFRTCTFELFAINWRCPPATPQVWLIAKVTHRNQEKSPYIYWFIMKGCSKEYRWTSRRKRCTVQGRWERGVELPCLPRVPCPPSLSVCSPTWKLSKPCTYRKASSRRHDRSLTPFQPFSLLKSMRGGTENSNLIILAWSFWWPIFTQEASSSTSRIISIEQETLLPPRKLQRL